VDKVLKEQLEEFVARRCEAALTENKEYMEKEYSEELEETELQKEAEILVYKKCISDIMAILDYFKM